MKTLSSSEPNIGHCDTSKSIFFHELYALSALVF